MAIFRGVSAALLTVSVLLLGATVTVRNPPPPPVPTGSELARLDAATDAQDLLELAIRVQGAKQGDDAENARAEALVTLLTLHVGALRRDGEPAPVTTASVPVPTGPSGAPTATAAPSGPVPPADAPGAVTAADSGASTESLVTALTQSANRRLDDAVSADPGTARMLAAAGVAQQLAAESLARSSGATAPGRPAAVSPAASPIGQELDSPSSCPASGESSASSAAEETADGAAPGATLSTSLAAVVEQAQAAVYTYQVALPRLPVPIAAIAESYLGSHEALLQDATGLGSAHCVSLPAPRAGYALDQGAIAVPAASLGAVENAGLPALGDLIGTSEASLRQWAIAALFAAADRAQSWGSAPEELPGFTGDAQDSIRRDVGRE